MMHTATYAATEVVLARWAQKIEKSALQKMLVEASRPGILSFALGLPAAELFPSDRFAQAALTVLSTDRSALQYGPSFEPLKAHVVSLMARRGVACKPEQVLLTTGAQQGMNLLTHLLLNPGGKVILEEMIYPGFRQVLDPFQPRLLTVPTSGESGMDVGAVESLLASGERPAFIYAISDGHNPLALSLSWAKRVRLVELARRYGVPIIEDDAYGFLHFDDEALPPMRSLDEDHVFYVGTFSKILAPALRVGWILAPPTLIPKLAIIKEASDINTSTFTQRAISAFLDSGFMDEHLGLLRREYKTRRDCMLAALSDHFPPHAFWRSPSNGLFIWVEIPGQRDLFGLLERAVKEVQVAFIPGQAFAVGDSPRGTSCIRLNFSNCNEEQIEEGIKRLARLIKRHSPQP